MEKVKKYLTTYYQMIKWLKKHISNDQKRRAFDF